MSAIGSWRPEVPTAARGRGLMLMKRLMDEVTVERDAGTTVTMSRPVGADAA